MNLGKLIKYLKRYSAYKNVKSKKKILFDILGAEVPGYIYNTILFTRTMNKLGYSIDYQMGNNQDKLKELYSFNAVKFYLVTRYTLLKYLPKILWLNVRYFSTYFNMDKLFNMHIDEVYIGDLIYDDYNRRQEQPSIDKINFRYLKKINEAFFYYCYYTNILKNTKYEYTILNHNCYVRNGLLGRIANKYNSKAMLVNGDYNLLARKLYPNSFEFYTILNKGLFKLSLNNDFLVKKAEFFFDNVMNKSIKTWDSVNFEVAMTNTDILEQKRMLELKESGKKIVVISSHVLIDNIVGADGRRQVYKDILTWLRETLKLCNKNKNIITFLKPHPREYAFKYKPTILDIYNELNLENVRIWPDNLDMKENSDLVDTLITIRGSVSFEFPGFGVPVVLAGKNHAGASGFDTVIEVDDVSKYEEIISNIHTLERLDEKTMKKNKLIYFMYFNSVFYNLNDELKFSKEDLFKNEYLKVDPKQLPSNPYKDNIEDILINKLEVFNKSYKEYTDDLELFLSCDDYNLLGEVQYKKKFLDVQ